jgi:hypothetical protein
VSRLRSMLAAPGGARLLGVIVALVGAALLVLGVAALGGGDGDPPGQAPPAALPSTTGPAGVGGPGGPGATGGPGTSAAGTTVPTSAPTTAPTPTGSVAPTAAPTAARAPLTVLNNSTMAGLGDRAAADAQRRGWQVAQVGNFGGRLPVTTVYYTPGDAAGERAARALAAQFPQIGRVYPRYDGLPPTPAGIVLVVTRDW